MTDSKPPDSMPFFLNSSINIAIGLVVAGVAGIFETCCRLGLFCIHFVAETWAPGIIGLYTIGAAAVWAYRRIKLGLDPTNTLPKITALPTPPPK